MDHQLKMRRDLKEDKPLYVQCIFQVMMKKPPTFCPGMYVNGARQLCCKKMSNQIVYAFYFQAYTTAG